MKPTKPTDGDDRCLNGRCWTGPMMLVETEKGSIPDLRNAVRLFLSKLYRKEMADLMARTLTLAHIPEQHTIIAFAMGRDPHATILREICAFISVHACGSLKTSAATYTFKLHEQDEDIYSVILAHYRWMKAVESRSTAIRPKAV